MVQPPMSPRLRRRSITTGVALVMSVVGAGDALAHGPIVAESIAAQAAHAAPGPNRVAGSIAVQLLLPLRTTLMSPVQRPVSGPALAFTLADELRIVHEQLATASRTARTLIKNGPLRATLMGLGAGGELARHSADGPITVHVLEGAVEFEAEGRTYPLPAGSLLALGAGVVHGVRSREGGIFLLTVAAPAAE